MIPVSLITGFLGSGKTTLLQRLIDRYRDRRMVYLVNEFGEVDVDGELLKLPPDELVTIPGGSIFCRCLVTDFINHLSRIAASGIEEHSDTTPVEGLIIEASGIADPRVVVEMLAETKLDSAYTLRSIVNVVDPGSFLKLIHTLPNIAAQVQACTVGLINKIDLYDKQTVALAEDALLSINPFVELHHTVQCEVDLDVFEGSVPADLQGEYAKCVDPNYMKNVVELSVPVEPDHLMAELEALRSELYRAKGFVPIANGMLYVDLSPAALTAQPTSDREGPGRLVTISSPDAQPKIKDFLVRLSGGMLIPS